MFFVVFFVGHARSVEQWLKPLPVGTVAPQRANVKPPLGSAGSVHGDLEVDSK
jgi:hypothetical protein